jgi:transcription antitermination factor NusG
LVVTQRGEAMQNSDLKKWYVLYTKPRWERKIAERLNSMGIECYCPLNRVDRKWSDRWKTVLEPLFRCYVFVRVSSENANKPLEINGVFNYVHQMKRPARVRDYEIEDIRRFLTEYKSVKLEKIAVGINDKVEVLYGPLMDKKGLVTLVHENFVKVAIFSLGYSLVATVSRSGIKRVDDLPETTLH